jgi:hypothetical protein
VGIVSDQVEELNYIDGDAGQPTEEERIEVERRWRNGELLPPPWVVIDLSSVVAPKTGKPIPAGTYVMIKAPKVWAERFAEEMNLDSTAARQPDRESQPRPLRLP